MRISIDEPEIKPVEKTEDSIEREAVKKTLKGEKKKLSQMKFSEKISYIWSYYKAPIIGTVVGVLLVGYIIYFAATRKDVMLMGIVTNDTGLKVHEFTQSLGAYLELTEKQEVSLQEGMFLNGAVAAENHDMSTAGTIMGMIAARELDFAICDEAGFSYVIRNELCKNVEDFLTEDTREVFSDRLVTAEGWEYPVAIDLTGTPFAQELELHQEESYLVLIALSGHDEQLMGFLEYLAEGMQGALHINN